MKVKKEENTSERFGDKFGLTANFLCYFLRSISTKRKGRMCFSKSSRLNVPIYTFTVNSL